MMIDRMLRKRGFEKVEDSEYRVAYEKKIDKFDYTHCLDIINKASGRHLVQTYASPCVHSEERGGAISETVGLEFPDMFLIALKAIYVGIQWRWFRKKK